MKQEKHDLFKNCSVEEISFGAENVQLSDPFYHIFLFKGTGSVNVDFTDYEFSGNIVLFTTPYQTIQFKAAQQIPARTLLFHGDFYCIEYHKQEVACNGLLFNNIYDQPFIVLNNEEFSEMHGLFDKLAAELRFRDSYSQAVVRAYLQLMLALSSKVKKAGSFSSDDEVLKHPIRRFKTLLELHFKRERSPSFYAAQLGVAPNTFSKQCATYFVKSPSQLIHERVILEAKKLIHLTRKSMKEIAAELNFDDENYFSRYFKKHANVTPTKFREDVGISVVADLSR
ncbi:helix-turn-helix domain-containing protein [Pedobacter sp. ASV1-7]|uniref:helix-turn-helix domain-containing protein n=1 Tax=Pedobacter sp. ASV1-7 TaxID=3145237 RepID=UPI0032E884A5